MAIMDQIPAVLDVQLFNLSLENITT